MRSVALNCSGRGDVLYGMTGTGNSMSLFNKVFDTRTLVRIIGALSALLVMKAVAAYLGFSWMAALASG
jgi:hypothetical protein